MKQFSILFTGLSGSGKTTIANRLSDRFNKIKVKHEILDGTDLRHVLSSELGYTYEDRETHRRRIIFVAELLVKHGVICIIPIISSKNIKNYAESKLGNIIEVYLKCPLEVCSNRDPQGHYHKIKKGEMKNFVGVDIPYEEPKNPDLVLETDKLNVEECVERIIEKIKNFGYL